MICGTELLFSCVWCVVVRDHPTTASHFVSIAQEVIDFLNNCGNQNLQYLLVPSRLEAALLVLDTDRDGHIDEEEWQDAIESALAAKLEARAAARAVQAKAAQKEIEEFTDSFLTAAARCFELIDKDGGGSLSI